MSFDDNDRHVLQRVLANVAVPAQTTLSLGQLLEGESGIEQRDVLYFDESLKVVIFLDFPACPEDKLQAYLRNLDLRIDGWAITTANGEEKPPVDSTATRDLICSVPVTNLEDPVTLVKQVENHGEVRLQLAWEAMVTLNRPRLRSPDQAVVFLPVATIRPTSENQGDEDYLEPFTIPEANVLQPMTSLAHGGSHPYLPISRLEKIVPITQNPDERIRIRHQPSEPIRAYAAVMPRLKYTKINTYLPNPTTIASLDIEVIPIIDTKGTIESIDFTMANGKATSLMPAYFVPTSIKSKDCVTFLYDLQSAQQSGTSTPSEPASTTSLSTKTPIPNSNLNIDILSIALHILISLSPTIQASITMSWTTNVDFSTALNPNFGPPSQPLQRTNRPTSLNFTPYPSPSPSKQPGIVKSSSTTSTNNASQTSVRTASTSLQQQVILTSIPRQPLTSILSISFTAPSTPPAIGVPFTWRVLIVNNSPKAVKLAIIPLPRIQRPTIANQAFAKRHAPRASNTSLLPIPASSTSAALSSRHKRSQSSIARPVVEDHVLYALHHASTSGSSGGAVPTETDIVSLTAELRIGPLGVGQCHETELRFVGYKKGVFSVDAIRIVDLTKEGEAVGVGAINDIRDLPEIEISEEYRDEDGEEEEAEENEGDNQLRGWENTIAQKPTAVQ